MHRMKSPFVALLAMLILAGPLLGKVTQTDPNDALQVSTPSAWERSRQETIPVAEPVARFDHSGIPDNSSMEQRRYLGDNLILASPEQLAYVDTLTMTVRWQFDPAYDIVRYSVLNADANPQILVSGETTCTLINVESNNVVWQQPDCPSGGFTLLDNGSILHRSADEAVITARLLEAETGEELWAYTYTTNLDLSRPNALSSDQAVLYAITTESVEALSLTTGDVVWTAPITVQVDVMLLEDHVLVLQNEEIIALDPVSGDELWLSFLEPGYFINNDWAQPGTNEKLIITQPSSVVILNLSTGLEVARFEDAVVSATQYMDASGEYVYPDVFVLRIANDAVGIDWATLEEAWRVSNTGDLFIQWTYNDVQMLTTPDSRTLLVDIHTGELLLTLDTTDYNSAQDGEIILFLQEQSIRAYDTVNRRTLWTYSPPEELRRWNTTSDHVAVTTPYQVYLLDARTGEIVEQRSHPDTWESYRLSSRFIYYWDGFNVTAVHHITGATTTHEGIYTFDDLSISSHENISILRYNTTVTLLDNTTGEFVFSTDNVLDRHAGNGEITLLTSDDDHHTVQLVESSGTVRWARDVSSDFAYVWFYPDDNKVILRARTNALVLDAQTGDIIMEIPVAYDPEGENDALYISPANAILVGSYNETVIYQVPAQRVAELVDETTIRAAPSASGVERGTFPAGTPVFPTGNERQRSDGLWIEVRVEDVTGWVRQDSVTGLPATPVASPAATP